MKAMRHTAIALAVAGLSSGIVALAAPAHAGQPGQPCTIPGATEKVYVDGGNGTHVKAVMSCVRSGSKYVWKITNYIQPGSGEG